jgi:hypothetical protein
VVVIWGRELNPDAEAGAHLAGDNNFKHRVRVEFNDKCKRAGLGVMACMQVVYAHHDGLELSACVVFGLEEPQPHVMGMVVDDEKAVAETMWGGDMNKTPKVRGHVEKGTGWFRASNGVAWCSSGFVEQA